MSGLRTKVPKLLLNGYSQEMHDENGTPPILSISLNVLFILVVNSCLVILTKMWEGSVLGNVRFECRGVQAILNGQDEDETTPPISSISLNVLFILLNDPIDGELERVELLVINYFSYVIFLSVNQQM